MRRKQVGVVAVLGASIMWAIEPIGVKLAYTSAGVLQTSSIRAAVAVFIGLSYILVTNKSQVRVSRNQIPALVYLGLVGTIFADMLYLYAIMSIPVINAVLIGHLQPVFIILMGFIWLKPDTLSFFDYLGVTFMMLSALLVSTRTIDNLLALSLGTTGEALVVAATVAWASTAVVMRRWLCKLNAGTITFYRFLIASLILMTISGLTKNLTITNFYPVIVGVVVGIGTILYYEGLKRIKAAQVSSLELTTPFFAALLGCVIIGENITLLQAGGMVLLAGGVLLLARREQAVPANIIS